ncbi:response regulator [Sulfurimonas sp.]|uniref:response regulator n=1 Tax=Sulfurimonas sp. TaxID=2022749 RepID=UPI0035659B59
MPDAKTDLNLINYEKYTIHIVDDSRSIVALLSELLGFKGYQITSTSNGQEAVAAINLNRPDLIILDVEMPVMDGYETIKILKKNKRTSDIPVIFNTSLTKPEVIENLFELGASDYISKPLVPKELLARVEKEIKNIMMQNILKEKIAKLAEVISTDPLTHTSNKLHMSSIINTKLEKLKQENRGVFSLMYIDIDNFNSFTKVNGINASENAIKKISLLLKRSIRDKDILSHWSWDKFMILFPQIIKDDLDNIAKTIGENIKKLHFQSNTSLTCCISMIEVSTSDTLDTSLYKLQTGMKEAKNIHKSAIISTDGRLLKGI